LTQPEPSVTSTPHLLPFDRLSPDTFERLCFSLIERERYENAEHLGAAGSDQGCDIAAWREGERWCFQCKRVQTFGPRDALAEVKKVLDLPESERPARLVFIATCNVSRKTRQRARTHCASQMKCEFWAITELDELVKRHPDIVRQFFTGMPEPSRPAHLFICYEPTADPDRKLAAYLCEFLTAQGHDVVLDTDTQTSEDWLEKTDRQIKTSNLLVILLSKESAHNEMVQAEVRRAYEYRRSQGHPHILPVRIVYEGLLPYSIEAFLDPSQYVLWQSGTDNERVGQDILEAIEGRLPKREPIQLQPVPGEAIFSEDGHIVTGDKPPYLPLSEFNSRFLEELEVPGGVVKLSDTLYIKRNADTRLERQLLKLGTTTIIRAPRQTGKTSLLVRGLHHARQNGTRMLNLNLQGIDRDHLQTLDIFLRCMAEFIAHRLGLDVPEMDEQWCRPLMPSDKLTFFMEDHVLPASDDIPVVLAIDEADRLLQTPLCHEFFAILRAWHDARPLSEQWNRLSIIIVISTEPYLLINEINQSPFNVGLKLSLEDFNEDQVADLVRRHGYFLKEAGFQQFMALLNGHPYLTRKALYVLATERCAWMDLFRAAARDHGPFGDHLRRYYLLLRDEPGLKDTLKQVINHGHCTDDLAFSRLLRAGLVKGSIDSCACRCDLYRQYLKDKL